jgi:hypothetical protein
MLSLFPAISTYSYADLMPGPDNAGALKRESVGGHFAVLPRKGISPFIRKEYYAGLLFSHGRD